MTPPEVAAQASLLPGTTPVGASALFSPPAPSPAWLDAGAAVLDKSGCLVSLNEALAAWLGASVRELLGKPLAALLGQRHLLWATQFTTFLNRAGDFERLQLFVNREHGAEHVEVELCSHGGTRFVRLESALPVGQAAEESIPEAHWPRLASHRTLHRLLRPARPNLKS